MESTTKREAVSDAVPSAKFLQGMRTSNWASIIGPQAVLFPLLLPVASIQWMFVDLKCFNRVLTAALHPARITALSTTLIKRLENILAAALDDTAGQTAAGTGNPPAPPSLIDTAVQQFQLEVESTAIVRAAEEIMMLTRTMKEIWLFGGLDTLAGDHDGRDRNGQDEAARRKMEEDVKVVEAGFKKFLEKYETTLDLSDTQE
ncbi:uncharacterized protein Z519_00807 [Cladophialophora bantiana CBS 173.52]|uniref:Uncharacterized protein n=1 Tax=Cladophialophora bantiana (strain ATCC 10958 / CBS 173.52 / CDC B-1940 / NIH 8579) TaxID=1442370 RepID=A0A0D2IQZ1_CLAB1|nr:uncharacterized protein Z519_00807 [Cladophialophora bantiana CBS 173.52]KIW99144.1 hypothetical protein Z519_00807 [Cladophialophora bantiana CBS 173.52]